MTDSNLVPPDIHAQTLEKLGSLQLDQGRTEEAAASWTKLLERYETARPIASIRYKLGKIFFAKGDVQKATEVWKPLKEVENSIWWNLAQEQLKNSEWGDNYKKYIKRIPAMSERSTQ